MPGAEKTQVKRLVEIGKREATVLEHSNLRVMIDDLGGMIPDMSVLPETLNAHWLPWFRSNSGKPFNENEDSPFWKANVLYNLAGNFPCLPSFGNGHIIDGIDMPPHGWTANQAWKFQGSGCHEGAGWALSTMEIPEKAMPLSFKKIDALVPGQNVHYTTLSVKNLGTKEIEICAAWHNTLGAPFLAEGSKLSACADVWMTLPAGSEFDKTSRFVPGAEFPNLKEAPLLKGGKVDISNIPGPLGYTDFATGRVPPGASLGWSSLVNPSLKMAYICFFTGPGAAGEDDIILRFNDLWMQYGGRAYTPWAPYEGGTDLTYCLGTENAVAAFAMGLDYSRQVKKVLDAPTTVKISGGEEKFLRYGTLFAPYGQKLLDEGVYKLEGEPNALVCKSKSGHYSFAADPFFNLLKELEKKILYTGTFP
jgi:hypothetical protein